MNNTENTDEQYLYYIEDADIYDGWCATFNLKTTEIVWRDAYFTNKLSPEFKKNWEARMRKQMSSTFSAKTETNDV